jgi:drug/metabolite transporter (DMT)-like permease
MSTSLSTFAAATAPSRVALLDRPEVRGLALGFLAASIWGSYLAMARAGVSAGLHATDIAALRYGVAGLIMLPWLLRHGIMGMAGMGMMKGAALTLLVGPFFIIIGVSGYSFAPLAHGAVVQPAALTLGSIGLAFLVLGDRPTTARVVGVAIIIAGLAVIAGPGLMTGTALTPIGDLLFAAAGLMWAVFSVFSRRWGVSPVAGTAVVSVLSAAAYVPSYVLLIGADRLLAAPLPMLAAQILVQGVLSGVVAVIAFSKTVEILGAGRAAVFPALVPATAILIGIPITGEFPNSLQLAGLTLVSTGLLVAIGVIALRKPRSH